MRGSYGKKGEIAMPVGGLQSMTLCAMMMMTSIHGRNINVALIDGVMQPCYLDNYSPKIILFTIINIFFCYINVL